VGGNATPLERTAEEDVSSVRTRLEQDNKMWFQDEINDTRDFLDNRQWIKVSELGFSDLDRSGGNKQHGDRQC
jgi:hypothetical protein